MYQKANINSESKKREKTKLEHEVSFALDNTSWYKLIQLPIKIHNKPFEGILDTVSTLSFINSKVLKDLNLTSKTVNNAKIKMLDQNCMLLNQLIKVEVEFDNKQMKQTFYVYEQLKYDLLLGIDFCRNAGITIEFKTKTIEISATNQTMDIEFDLLTELEVKIPPHCMAILKYKLETEHEFALFDPNEELAKQHQIIIDRGLMDLTNDFEITIYNTTPDEVVINKEQKVGKLTVINEITEKENLCLIAENIAVSRSDNFLKELQIVNPNPEIHELLQNFQHLFADNISQIKRATNVEHTIDTGTNNPIRQIPYKSSPAEKEIIKKQINEMLSNGIIKESQSPWASPVVLVKKKDGKTRFCIDYRKLNAVTKKDAGPLPLIADTLDALNDSVIITKLDLKSGYWAVGMEETSKEKTAFITFMGLYQWEVLPFGLATAPSTFQRYLNRVLSDYLHKFCLVYIDDLIIFSKSESEHIAHIRCVFQCLDSHNLRLNPEKCEFLTTEVAYLGHVITPEGVKPDPDKTKYMENFPIQRKVRDVRAFLGLSGNYRRFVKGYANIARPLNELLKKEKQFVWSPDCEKAFEDLKKNLIDSPILGHFKPDLPVIIYTDASGYAIGAIMSQVKDGKEYVVSYNSKSLTATQMKWCTSEREALAIVWAVKKLRHYVFGSRFTIRTDNCALCFLMQAKNPNGRLARWSLLLQEYYHPETNGL